MTREELIAALEKATGPDEDLDNAIADGLRVRGWCFDDEGLKKEMFSAEPYTASIDAALTLVPDGSYWNVLTEGEGDGFLAAVVTRQRADAGERLSWLKGATPALALCIAALRARA